LAIKTAFAGKTDNVMKRRAGIAREGRTGLPINSPVDSSFQKKNQRIISPRQGGRTFGFRPLSKLLSKAAAPFNTLLGESSRLC
jgi:hypothetical protein